jgi:hypothetical protein
MFGVDLRSTVGAGFLSMGAGVTTALRLFSDGVVTCGRGAVLRSAVMARLFVEFLSASGRALRTLDGDRFSEGEEMSLCGTELLVWSMSRPRDSCRELSA